MPLADLQQAFAQALFERESEAQAMPLFKGDGGLHAARLALYRGNLTANWTKALATAFPVLQALVGEEFFEALAREYGKAHPSACGDLNQFGARFAGFLGTCPHVAAYPYFADTARLEWAVHRAHYADNAVPLEAARLMSLNAEQLDRARLTLHPACTLIASPWSVAQIWLAHQPDSGQALPEHVDQACHALVVRPQWRAGVVTLTAAAHAALAALQQGQPLGSALDRALALDQDFDFASHLQHWLQQGVLAESAGWNAQAATDEAAIDQAATDHAP